jgi:hypothetical protein
MRYDPEEAARIRELLEKIQKGEISADPSDRKTRYGHQTRFPGTKADMLLKTCEMFYQITKIK